MGRSIIRGGSLCILLGLAACGGHSGGTASSGGTAYGGYPYDGEGGESYASSRDYAPPGPPSDPWGPYIKEASQRFSVPESWIRAVMRQESAGRASAVSSAGAMGLLQLMPGTYALMRDRYHLGGDPYDPHNNILAGTAYIREMYDQYGSPGFLAAYNAGPGRLSSFLNGTGGLPSETVNYVSIIAPRLGGNRAPAASSTVMMAQAAPSRAAAPPAAVSYAASSAGCDPDAAYDPSRPCAPAAGGGGGVTLASYDGAPQPFVPHGPTAENCDKDAAFDPSQPCKDLGAAPAPAAPVSYGNSATVYASAATDAAAYPSARNTVYTPPPSYRSAPPPPVHQQPRGFQLITPAEAAAAPAVRRPAPQPLAIAAVGGGRWSVQVGAFASRSLAQTVATGARDAAPVPLRNAHVEMPTTSPFGGNILYRARLTQLSATQASQACSELSRRQLSCMVVPPGS